MQRRMKREMDSGFISVGRGIAALLGLKAQAYIPDSVVNSGLSR